jgi:hypothetical protein
LKLPAAVVATHVSTWDALAFASASASASAPAAAAAADPESFESSYLLVPLR